MNQPDIVCKGMVVCEKTSLDPQSQLLSLTNLLDRVFVTVQPHELAQAGGSPRRIGLPMELVVFWEKGSASGAVTKQFEVHFIDPEGKTLFDHVTSDIKMLPETRKFYSIIKLDGLPCGAPGRHVFEVHTNDEGSDVKVLEESIEIVMIDAKGAPLKQ